MNNPTKHNVECKWCKKHLRKFTKINDWNRRSLHKKCYREIYKQVNYYNNKDLKKFLV